MTACAPLPPGAAHPHSPAAPGLLSGPLKPSGSPLHLVLSQGWWEPLTRPHKGPMYTSHLSHLASSLSRENSGASQNHPQQAQWLHGELWAEACGCGCSSLLTGFLNWNRPAPHRVPSQSPWAQPRLFQDRNGTIVQVHPSSSHTLCAELQTLLPILILPRERPVPLSCSTCHGLCVHLLWADKLKF